MSVPRAAASRSRTQAVRMSSCLSAVTGIWIRAMRIGRDLLFINDGDGWIVSSAQLKRIQRILFSEAL